MSGAPGLTETLTRHIKASMYGMHTCLTGRVVKYDELKKSATVRPNLKIRLNGEDVPYPVIVDVPVLTVMTAAGGLHVPVAADDPVLLVFGESSFEEFLRTGLSSVPADPRRFDLTDAVAIPGVFPFRDVPDYVKSEHVQLHYHGGFVEIDNTGKIVIGNSAGELFQALSDALANVSTALNTLSTDTVITSLGPQPLVNAATYATLATSIDAIKAVVDSIKGTV